MGMIKKDLCCNDWKNVIKQLWAQYQNMIRSVSVGGNTYHPDGDGKVTLSDIAIVTLTDNDTYYTVNIDTE